APHGEQRLHVFVCRQALPDCAPASSDGNAGKEPAHRTSSERHAPRAVRGPVHGGGRVRHQSSGGGEAGREGLSQRSQSRRKERLDGRVLRSAGASVMASGTDGQREKLSGITATRSQPGTPGKSGPAIHRVFIPKASAREFHQSNRPRLDNALLALRKHSRVLRHRRAFADCFGANPVASALGSSARRDPGLRIEHNTGGQSGHPKPELSTLLESGTFYFALTRESAPGNSGQKGAAGVAHNVQRNDAAGQSGRHRLSPVTGDSPIVRDEI